MTEKFGYFYKILYLCGGVLSNKNGRKIASIIVKKKIK
jgi:hypothetical protein